MRAAVYRSLGGPDVVEITEVDKPVPGLSEIRIKVQAATLNPTDAAAWSGGFFPAPPEGSAYGLGWDVSGVVDAVGPGTHWTPGQPVIAFSHGVPLGLNRGQAEYIVVPSQAIAAAPAGVDPVHAATIPLNGLTAAQSVELLGIQAGQTVLITGAEGAVGGYAVQLAKRRGAVVIATDLSPDGEFASKVAGADVYVPASQPLVEAVRKVRPEGVDAVLDTARLGQAVIGAVADGGRFVTTRLDALPQTERGIRVLLTQVGPDAAMLTTLSDLAAAGDLALRVAKAYPLQDAAKAYAHMTRGGFQGRVVLTME
ncbi:NADP-dependent oxidoreductase [Streptomyces scabiei]|nr:MULTISPECIES: NADP-dependent oxidoreductase [Streptomyces]MDW8471526.1 NADP-dependent oxidoreductase [Streptomyces scabiei]MDX2571649.1 NADP-dependent oxidoreductase [Streptomyces scabiei]MDX3157393.1 NADP-dependent oxidoreductase [Streptomyces scabiei]MDX3256660.1 NADP-dependent oxidoreductase [Streptomyces scabiei]MDX3291157.1 NADP-dependent oxidoreductase [Streptomyces scabiei]